ncbi:hypothetical protein [Methylocystis sp.]|uniref:hypothetical protein n=1 Tax=Methylocystis sp. TaxID=1911079 RepID=UPI0027366F3B|nr:hypothetical protein [Methylocystis sp.]MDP3553060.1 hypothetical protein [Methylocystis sp.]
MSGLEAAMAGVSAAGTLLGGYGEYRSGMDTAAAIDASRPYDLINAANKAQGLRYAADTALAGAQRQAIARTQDKELALSRSRAVAAAGGGSADDTTVVNQEALIERQGEFYKALEMFGGLELSNQANYEANNALLEGVNTYNAKGVQASRARGAARMQAAGTLLSSAGAGLYKYRRSLPFGPSDTDVAIAEGHRDAAKVRADYAASALRRRSGRQW